MTLPTSKCAGWKNPAHDLITTERLPDEDQEAAREHLNDASAQIRDIIEQAIREQDEADISNLTELAEMFPDLDVTLPGNRELNTAHHHAKAAITSSYNR